MQRRAPRDPTRDAGSRDRLREADRSLATALIAGDPEAFDPFVERFGPLILNFGRRMCGRRDDAEEVLQETLLRAYRSLRHLKDPSALKSWVYRVAANTCMKMRRDGSPRATADLEIDSLVPAPGPGGAPPSLADWSGPPIDRLLRHELRGVLERSILDLPAPFRLVVVLRDQEEFSTREVARILGITETLVKVRLHRARLALRRAIDGYLAPAGRVVAPGPAPRLRSGSPPEGKAP
jgi:RNA polymerase sigma-70 factor (ECF subfamily)